MRRFICILTISCTFLPGALLKGDDAVDPKAEFDPAHVEKMREGLDLFKQTVRQILIKECVDCHGGDEVQSQLDLATRKGLMRGGGHGAAIKPGKAKESRLVALISHNEKPKMPEGGDKLPTSAIEAIARWIDLGAPYDQPLVAKPRDPDAWVDRKIDPSAKEHWAFQPLLKPELPAVKYAAWPKTAVDKFVLAKLEEKGLAPRQAADKRRLIRRAYFDLIGLPPTAEEVEKFVHDADPQAYEKVLDQLLQSPHYGERWGRHWLDAARFAESHGFEQDYDRPYAYHFRDFVIEALNQDLPYDQFVRWQLAGDEFAPENPLALKATGFLGAGVFPTQITANEVERTRYDALDDMAGTVGTAMLGLTISCARCHDHKFDPIPSADYYRFITTFATTVRSNIDVQLDTDQYRVAKAAFDQAHQPFVAAREQYEKEQLPGRFAEWEKSESAQKTRESKWNILPITTAVSKGKATLTKQEDGSYLASGTNPDFDHYTFTAELKPGTYTGVRLEALAHSSLTKGGPGRAGNGNFSLTNFEVQIKIGKDGKASKLQLANPQCTFEQTPQNLFVKYTIDDDKKTGWAVDPQFGKDHAATYEFAEELQLTEVATLTFQLDFNGNNKHNIGRPRLSITSAAKPLSVEVGGQALEVATAFATPVADRTPQQQQTLLAWYRPLDAEWKKLHDAEQQHLTKRPQPNMVKMMVCSEGVTPIRHHTQGADFFKETFFLKRGDCDQKQGEATQSFLQVLMTAPEGMKHWQVAPPPGAKTSYRRRALANWITDTEYGAGQLLARVMVNRVWHHHFGRGIVTTNHDFGLQGAKPTNPALLDWLAGELMRNGWRLKPLHKLLMTSAVYLQDSTFDAVAAKADPQNDYLWRYSPHRLEAELIRDNILAVSGELDRTQFGPGSLDESHKRRSIYFMIKRSKLITMMQIFDQPEPLVSVGQRPATTVAPQALMFMNNPQVRKSAAAFAAKLLPHWQNGPEEAIRHGYLAATGRLPKEGERTDSNDFLLAAEKAYAKAGDKAKLQALTDFCQVLFELNEFVYVE